MRLFIAIILGNTLLFGGRSLLHDWHRIHSAPHVRFIVPDGFRGPFAIEHDPDAPRPQVRDGWHHLVVGSNGVVALPDPSQYEVMRGLEAATASGRQLYTARVPGDALKLQLLGSVNGIVYGYVGNYRTDPSPVTEQVLRGELGKIVPEAREADRAAGAGARAAP